MAQKLLVTNNLTDDMVEAGQELIQRLDASSSDVTAALWFYFPEDGFWKLLIASPQVASEGPRAFYKHIKTSNNQSKEDETVISLLDIMVTDTNNPLVQTLKVAISTGPGPDISHIRFSKNTINGHFIDDSYIYRMNIGA